MARESGAPAVAREKLTPAEASPSDGEAPKRPDTSEFVGIPCGPARRQFVDLAAIHPARKLDFLELRSLLAGLPKELRAEETRVMLSTGTPCSGSAPKKCQRALAELTPSTGDLGSCVVLCIHEYFVGTNGNEVFLVTMRRELEEFLRPIDTASEAQLIARAHGYGVGCGDEFDGTRRVAGYRETSDGFELLMMILVSHCPIQYARGIVSVGRDAVVKEIWRELLPAAGDYRY